MASRQLEGERTERLASVNAAIAERRRRRRRLRSRQGGGLPMVADAVVDVASRTVELVIGRRRTESPCAESSTRSATARSRLMIGSQLLVVRRQRGRGARRAHRPDPPLAVAGGLRAAVRRHGLADHLRPAVLEGVATVKQALNKRTAKVQAELDAVKQDEEEAAGEAERIRQALGDIENERAQLLAQADERAAALLVDGRARPRARSPSWRPRPMPTSPCSAAGRWMRCAPRSPSAAASPIG